MYLYKLNEMLLELFANRRQSSEINVKKEVWALMSTACFDK